MRMLFHHLEGIVYPERSHAEDRIIEELGEDSSQAEHDAGSEPGVPREAADQFPFSPDHLLDEQTLAAGDGEQAPCFLPDLPFRLQVQGNGPELRFVLDLLARGLQDHGETDLAGGLDRRRTVRYVDLAADRDTEVRQ